MTDENTPTISKQRRWQEKQRKKGMCPACGARPIAKSTCEVCAAKRRARQNSANHAKYGWSPKARKDKHLLVGPEATLVDDFINREEKP